MPCITPTYTPDDPEGEPVFTPDTGEDTDFTEDTPSWHMVEEDDSQCIGEGVTVQLATTPTGLTVANPTVSTLDVSWNTSVGSSSYEVDRALSAAGPWTNVFAGAGTSFTDTLLDDGVEYFYRVRGVNALGASDWSAPVSGTTIAIILPDVPTGLAASNPTETTLDISWNAALNADSYEVDRALTALGPWTNVYADVGLSFTDTGLSLSTQYFYRVRSVNIFGNSDWSAVASGTTSSVLALTRASLGRLAAHSLTPITGVTTAFVGADWTGGAGITVGVLGGRLRIHAVAGGVNATAHYTAVAAREDMYIQAVVSLIGTGQRLGVAARIAPTDLNAFANLLELSIPTGFSSIAYIREVSGGVQQQSDGLTGQNIPIPEGFKLWIKGTEGLGRIRDPGYVFNLSGLVLSGAGHAALIYSSGSGNNSSFWDTFSLCTDHVLTVNGPTSGWRADILNSGGAVIATATAAAGVASVDLDAAGVTFPDAVKLEIRDTGTDALIIDATPSERLWGGDVWTYTA